MSRISRIIAGTALVAALGLGMPPAARADDSLEEALAQFADTPQEHKALADYYKRKAETARKSAEDHRKMATMYSGQKVPQVHAMGVHCAKLAETQDALAKQYDELAAEHLGLAK